MKAGHGESKLRDVFVFLRTACSMLQGQKGGWNINRLAGGTQSASLISLIPLCLSSTHRPPPYRSRKIGEDESDPHQKRGVMWPR